MIRSALRAAGAMLCLAFMNTVAAVPAPTAKTPAAATPQPSPAIEAISAAAREVTARQADMPYLQWLAALPGFHFSPATSRLLVRQFGTDRLLSVTRTVLQTGEPAYVITVPTLRRTNPDGSSYAWSAMQGQLAIQPDGQTVIGTFSAPRIVAEDKTARLEARGLAYSSNTRYVDGLSFGEGSAEVGTVEMTGKKDGTTTRLDGLYSKFGVTDGGATVDMFSEVGIRTLAVQGERIDDIHMNVRFANLDKSALQTLGKLGKQAPAPAAGLSLQAQHDAILAPLVRQLGLAVVTHGAAIDVDDISFSYRGNKARLHGQLHLENATQDDLAQPVSLLKKIAGHMDVEAPLAMLHALAENMARTQLAKQQPGADAAAIATLGTKLYNDLLRTAVQSGYLRVDGDMLVTTIDLHDGVILLNGKPVQLPSPTPPVAALDSMAGAGVVLRARRIAEKCALPDYPAEVVAADSALSLSMRLMVNADGTVSQLMLAHSSGLPGYDTAVLAAAAHCTYIPALRDGKPVAVPSVWDIVRVPGSTHP